MVPLSAASPVARCRVTPTHNLSLALLTSLAALVPATAEADPSGAGAGVDASMLCVGGPQCYPTIQAAVNAAGDGQTIDIGPGTFAGRITIDRSVNLTGAAAQATRISGGGPVLTIGSPTATPTVTLSDLTITGGDTRSDPETPRCGPTWSRVAPATPR